jgi:hypothetical protein
VKSPGNPQGTRTLANELFGAQVFRGLGVNTPQTAVLRGTCTEGKEEDLLFGSRIPFDGRSTIYDFLPRPLLGKVVGRRHQFMLSLLADKWMGQTDSRQALFFRAANPSRAFEVSMIDFGHLFGGNEWRFNDGPLQGLAMDRDVYSDFGNELDVQQHFLSRAKGLDFNRLLKQVPVSWLQEDSEQWLRLIDRLPYRMERAVDLAEDSLREMRVRSSRIALTPAVRMSMRAM